MHHDRQIRVLKQHLRCFLSHLKINATYFRFCPSSPLLIDTILYAIQLLQHFNNYRAPVAYSNQHVFFSHISLDHLEPVGIVLLRVSHSRD